MAKKKRTAAQKRATAKLVALMKRKRKNPAPKKRKAKRAPAKRKGTKRKAVKRNPAPKMSSKFPKGWISATAVKISRGKVLVKRPATKKRRR